jgi:hypothetical protein
LVGGGGLDRAGPEHRLKSVPPKGW